MNNRLYVLICKDLSTGYQGVQGAHCVAQRLIEKGHQDWKNEYLIFLSADLEKWQQKLTFKNIDYTAFKEPDLDNKVTAIAVLNNSEVFKNLKLIGVN